MNKMVWNKPELVELSIQETEHGTPITKHVDATRSDGDGYTFFSFS
jgi:hypothetical protein